MNTEHELFGELHEQEENGLFGNEHRRQHEEQQEQLDKSDVISRFSLDERVYSLRHKKYGVIKSIDGDKGYLIAFSKDKYDYEYHYPNEVIKKSYNTEINASQDT